MQRRFALGMAALAVALSCATPKPEPIGPVVVEGYQLFAKRDCTGVHANGHNLDVGSPTERSDREWLRLLDAYCLELDGNVVAAKDLYSSIVAGSAWVAAEAKHRLIRLDIETIERVSGYREKQNARTSESPEQVHLMMSPPPNYPFPAYDARIEGWVRLDFEVLSDGRISDAVVLASDPPFVFDRAALVAIQRWTYEASPDRESFRHRVKLQFEL